MTIRLIDARRGLYRKCKELFGDEKIAEQIYRYLCDGIEECENAERVGKWIETGYVGNDNYNFKCSCCGHSDTHSKAVEVPYCWYCGARMTEGEEE